MKKLQLLNLAGGLFVAATMANAGTIAYICDANIDATVAGTCNTLNTTIAGLYSSTFSNANANIYIQYGTAGLGQSTQAQNFVSYDAYRNALIAASSGNAVDVGAIASLPVAEPALYSGGQVEVSAALGTVLGLTGLSGVDSAGNVCSLGTAGCYNALITLATPAILGAGGQGYYYRDGVQSGDAYDFFSIVEHETNEVLGSASCVDTSGPLTDGCGDSSPSAVDLFRYDASGAPVFIDLAPLAFFSYDGGLHNGAAGALYNTLANGTDYGDFASNCAFVQDGTGCLGSSFDITTDGGAEANILDAVGYNRSTAGVTPEPGTIVSLSLGGLVLALYRRRKV